MQALNENYCEWDALMLKQIALAKYFTVEMLDQRLKEIRDENEELRKELEALEAEEKK